MFQPPCPTLLVQGLILFAFGSSAHQVDPCTVLPRSAPTRTAIMHLPLASLAMDCCPSHAALLPFGIFATCQYTSDLKCLSCG